MDPAIASRAEQIGKDFARRIADKDLNTIHQKSPPGLRVYEYQPEKRATLNNRVSAQKKQ